MRRDDSNVVAVAVNDVARVNGHARAADGNLQICHMVVAQAGGGGNASAPHGEVHLAQFGAIAKRTVGNHGTGAAHHHASDQHIAHGGSAAVFVEIGRAHV